MMIKKKTRDVQRAKPKKLFNATLVLLMISLARLPAALANEVPDFTLENVPLPTNKGLLTDLEADHNAQVAPIPILFTDISGDGIKYKLADSETIKGSEYMNTLKESAQPDPQEVSLEAKDLLLEAPEINEQNSGLLFTTQTTESLPEENIITSSEDNLTTQADDNRTDNPEELEEEELEDLAKKSQNPIANLISLPFHNTTSFGVGQFDRTNNTLNIQPVIPISINENWLLVNRTIIPVVYQPELTSSVDDAFGLGDITYQGFFVPNSSGAFTWGVGPAIVFPTATDILIGRSKALTLGAAKWSIGPSVVVLTTLNRIVTGVLVSNVWSFAGDSDRSDLSLMTIQPLFTYNFDGGWYVNTSPVITANWLGKGEKWTLPIGGGFGRIFNIGTQLVNASLQGYWNALKREGAADWTLRTSFVLLFPK